MSTINKLFESLENTKISECSEAFDERMERIKTEQCFCGIEDALTDENMENCPALAVFNELWGWYCGGTENGVWQYFEHSVKELIEPTAEALRKYGNDEFATQYINAGKELMPLMECELPYKESELIDKISNSYGSYIDDHAGEICAAMKRFLIANKNEICHILADADIIQPDDVLSGGFDFPINEFGDEQQSELSSVLEVFSGLLDEPALSDEHRAELAAVIAKARGSKAE